GGQQRQREGRRAAGQRDGGTDGRAVHEELHRAGRRAGGGADGGSDGDCLAEDGAGGVVGGQRDVRGGRGHDGRARLGAGRGRLDVADVVGGDAVEGVAVAGPAGVAGRSLPRGEALPEGEGAAVVRDVDGERREVGAAAVVAARPAHGDVRRADGGQGRDAARRPGGVERVEGGRRGEGRVGVEDDRRLVVDRRAAGQTGRRRHAVGEITLAVVVGVIDGEEAVAEAVGGQAGRRVERLEGRGHGAR